MTTEERSALVIERTDLQRKYQKRKDAPGYAANAQSLLDRINEIDAKLDEPMPVGIEYDV